VWLIVFVGVWVVLEVLAVFLSILLGTLLGLGIEAIWRSIRG
jgi:hypothetical protein